VQAILVMLVVWMMISEIKFQMPAVTLLAHIKKIV